MALQRASRRPRELLESSELAVPPAVERVTDFLTRCNVWYSLSRNPPVRSCRDAARRRYRLGHEGVPLWDELKSFFGRIAAEEGPDEFVVIHCRGDRKLDLDRVTTALGLETPPIRVGSEEIEMLGMAYGLVHPFVPWALDGQLITSRVRQVFDTDLLTPIGVPGTVTTNAGDLTWAVELRVGELAAVIDDKVIADISVSDDAEPDRPAWTRQIPTIGIITGNSPESGIALWHQINRTVRTRLGELNLGDVSMPRVIVHSLPEMGLSMELPMRHKQVWDAIESHVNKLLEDGATTLAIACNTTQFFADQISQLAAARNAVFVSMPDAVARWLADHNVSEIAMVGIESVSSLGEWSAYRAALSGIKVEVPRPEAMRRIDRIAYKVKMEGPTDGGLNHLRDILRQEVRCDHVLLALTELSLLAERPRRARQAGQVLVDSLAVYAEAVADALGFQLPDET